MKKTIWIKALAVALTAVLGFSLAGCSGGLSESEVSYAGPALDNVLAGIKDKDLSEFSKDFDDTMKNIYTQEVFDDFVSLLQTKIGDYVSKTFGAAAPATENNVTYTKVIYKAKYTNETSDVLVTIVFDGQQKVTGLFFSSPNLAKQ